jgi:predicted nuclease with TOPRIM domain
MKAK